MARWRRCSSRTHGVEGVAEMLKAHPSEIGSAAATRSWTTCAALEKELARLKAKLAASQGDDLADQAVSVGHGEGARRCSSTGPMPRACARPWTSSRTSSSRAAIVLGSVEGGKVTLIAGVTSDLTAKVKAGELVNFVAQQVGGKGGGRPDMAQAGGTDPAKLPEALGSVQSWVREKLG